MTRLALIALVLAACGGPMPVYLHTSEDLHGPVLEPSDRALDVLDEAFGLWGLEYVLVDDRYGAIDLELVDVGRGVYIQGRYRHRSWCEPEVRAAYDPITLAHEIGHVGFRRVGYEGDEAHHPDPDNVMHVVSTGDEITATQWDEAHAGFARLRGCVP